MAASSSKGNLEALRKLTDGLTSQGNRILQLEARVAELERLLQRGPQKGATGRLTESEWLARRRQVMKENGRLRWAKKRAKAAADTEPPAKRRKK
jgi:hypothetical protein